jgi:hypothetical protein
MPKFSKKLSVVSLFVLVIVYISPATQNKSPGSTFTFKVLSNTGNYSISGLDLFINYDKSAIEITSVNRGSGISNFSEWINTIDNTNGKISYTATTQNLSQLVSGSNVEILSISGHVKSSASGGNYNITFGSSSSLVDGNGDSIGANTGPGVISVSGIITEPATPTQKPSATPTQVPSGNGNVFVSPQSQTRNTGETFTFAVKADTGGNNVAGVDLFVNYNSSIFEVTNVARGAGISGFSEWVNNIDNNAGKISYTATTQNLSQTANGSSVELIKVTVRVKSGASGGTYNLSFGSGTILVDANGDDIGASKQGGKVTVRSSVTVTPTEPPTGGSSSIFVSPQTQSRKQGETFNFTVRGDTGGNQVAGIDLFVTYNTSVFEITNVTQGTGISAFSEWVNNIDNNAGRISYTATTQNLSQTVQGANVELIRVTARVKSNSPTGTYGLSLTGGSILVNENGDDIGASTIEGKVTVTTTSVTPTPKPTTTPQPPDGTLPIVENFEGYSGSNANLRSTYNYEGNGTVISLSTSNDYDGRYSVKLDYAVGNSIHSGAWRHLPESMEDWESYNAIRLFKRPDGSRREIVVQFSEEDNDHWEAYIYMSGSTPGVQTIRFSQFVKPAWNTSGDGRMELDDITGFGFYVRSTAHNPSPGSGTIYLDAFKLVTMSGPTPTPRPTTTPTVFIPSNTPTDVPPPVTFTPTSSPVPSPPSVDADTTLYLVADPPVYINDTFEVDLMIDTGKNEVVGTEVYITYDPNMIQALDVVPGSFFPDVVETVENIDAGNGRITTVLHILPQATPIKGVGTLAVLSFTALQMGTTTIDISADSIVGAVNTGYQNALRTRRGVTIDIVRPSIVGDINDMGTYCGDGEVNILDYTILFEHFGESPSTHPCADIDEDGAVNILDYVLLYENFGKSL